MSAFGIDGFGTVSAVTVDVYTSAYRVSGSVQTRFSRVAEILNQQSSAHLTVEHASITEYAVPGVVVATPSVLVSVEEILVMIATDLTAEGRSEMRIPNVPSRRRCRSHRCGSRVRSTCPWAAGRATVCSTFLIAFSP
jgi:hypothetical protein